MAQVRLDDDTAALVEQVRDGQSLSKTVNRLLRETLVSPPPAAPTAPQTVGQVVPATRKVGRPGATGGRCMHPLLRRIGNRCARCGETV